MIKLRSRYWHTVITQENLTLSALEYIQSLYAKGLDVVRFSVLHTDRSKPHYHIILHFNSPKSIDFLEQVQKNINSYDFQIIKNVISFVEYIDNNGGFHKKILKGKGIRL